MGDMLTLIEKAEEVFEKDQAEAAATKLLEGDFTLDDFLDQMQQIKKMGPLSGLVGMLPGVPKEMRDAQIDDREIARVEGIIRSMTPAERADPDLIDASRRNRIATGSGVQPAQVSELVKQFKEVSKMMKRMGGMGSKRMKKARKAKKGAKGSGRATPKGRVSPKGPAPLRLPTIDPNAPGLGGPAGGLGDPFGGGLPGQN
jgi:signal recognition particle subunit SRP54